MKVTHEHLCVKTILCDAVCNRENKARFPENNGHFPENNGHFPENNGNFPEKNGHFSENKVHFRKTIEISHPKGLYTLQHLRNNPMSSVQNLMTDLG